ncbi:hypothetical protein JW906_06310 [bacterium]|nr:hypothetical protein [bacterium]
MSRFKTSLFISCLYVSCLFAGIKFTGDVTAVSTYVFRGIKQGSGPALQGTAAWSCGYLTGGLWLSSVNFSENIETESDFFVEASWVSGGLETAAGVMFYSYDGFRTFNAYADYELEIYAKAAIGPAGLSLFHVPSQKSTAGDPVRSNFWMELNLQHAFPETALSATFGTGTYSSRYLEDPKKESVSTVVFSIEKAVAEDFSANYFYSMGLDPSIGDILYLTLSWCF